MFLDLLLQHDKNFSRDDSCEQVFILLFFNLFYHAVLICKGLQCIAQHDKQ